MHDKRESVRLRGIRFRAEHPEYEKEKYQKHSERIKAYSREYAKTHRALVNKKNAIWRSNHPGVMNKHRTKRRAIKNGLSEHFSDYEWKLLCEQYDQRCLKCGQQKPLTVDHVVPLILGGSDTIDNIQPLCLSCNSSKGAHHADYRMREPIKVTQYSFLDSIYA